MRNVFIGSIIAMAGMLGAGTVYGFIKEYPSGDQIFFALALWLVWAAFVL